MKSILKSLFSWSALHFITSLIVLVSVIRVMFFHYSITNEDLYCLGVLIFSFMSKDLRNESQD